MRISPETSAEKIEGRASRTCARVSANPALIMQYSPRIICFLDVNKYLIILYWQDCAERDKLKVIPHGKIKKRGIFSTRAPVRPNPIAFCLVELVDMNRNKLTVKWLDALDGSPLLDIKPYWEELDTI